METFPSSEKVRKLENIKKKLLGKDDPRETLLSLFGNLEDDYDLVEQSIVSLKKEGALTNDEQDRLRDIDDAYAGALNEWIEENTPPPRG